MADIEQQLHEDRALRNAARRLVTSGLDHLKGDMAQKGLGARLRDRMKDGADQLVESSAEMAMNNRAKLGAGLALGALAMLGWIFRDQLADAINAALEGDSAQDPQTETPSLDEGASPISGEPR